MQFICGQITANIIKLNTKLPLHENCAENYIFLKYLEFEELCAVCAHEFDAKCYAIGNTINC